MLAAGFRGIRRYPVDGWCRVAGRKGWRQMRAGQGQEPLLPPWVGVALWRLAPLAVLSVCYYLLNSVLHVPTGILVLVLFVLGVGVLVYFGGRLYKPFHVGPDGKCMARGAVQRATCRHFASGARLGGACGRLKEDGRCRYVR